MQANQSYYASLNLCVDRKMKTPKDISFYFFQFVFLDAVDGLIIELRPNCSKNQKGARHESECLRTGYVLGGGLYPTVGVDCLQRMGTIRAHQAPYRGGEKGRKANLVYSAQYQR